VYKVYHVYSQRAESAIFLEK